MGVSQDGAQAGHRQTEGGNRFAEEGSELQETLDEAFDPLWGWGREPGSGDESKRSSVAPEDELDLGLFECPTHAVGLNSAQAQGFRGFSQAGPGGIQVGGYAC